MSYGINFLCSKIGGLWCYWPSDTVKIIFALLIIAVILFFVLRRKKR